MKNEEAIAFLSQYVGNECYTEKCQQAHRMAIEALRDEHSLKMVPLTMEQLREMDGKPVFYKRTKQWFIVELHHPDFGECIITQTGYFLSLKTAAERGLYAYPPAHIDREAWTGCVCNNGKKNCCTCVSMECHLCVNGSKYKRGSYCSACGRPLTEEAWAELEKRLRG